MVNIKNNAKDLEKALGSASSDKQSQGIEMPRDVEIGFHQGALNTLVNERNELIKMAQNVEIIMQAHIKRLEELGVKIHAGAPAKNKKK